MGMYAVQADDSGDLAALGDAARNGRTAAASRRRQMSQGKVALNGDGVSPAAENQHGNGAGAPPAAENGQGAPSGAQGDPGDTAVATDGVAAAHFGRAVSKQRRRQMSQGKQALNGDGASPAGENLHGNGAGRLPPLPTVKARASGGQGAPGGTGSPPTAWPPPTSAAPSPSSAAARCPRASRR